VWQVFAGGSTRNKKKEDDLKFVLFGASQDFTSLTMSRIKELYSMGLLGKIYRKPRIFPIKNRWFPLKFPN
jgi:hypothetical protein